MDVLVVYYETHRVNGSPEGVQRTNTHDDVHDGMVVHSGPSVAEHYCGQVARHFPHLPHVLVVDQMVEFWDKFRGEEGVVCQCGFINTTRFGRDVVQNTLIACPPPLFS